MNSARSKCESVHLPLFVDVVLGVLVPRDDDRGSGSPRVRLGPHLPLFRDRLDANQPDAGARAESVMENRLSVKTNFET